MTRAFRVHGYAAMKKNPGTKAKTYPVTADQVIPSLWATAMTMAKGDGKLIQIVSKSQVIIHPNLKSRRVAK